MVGKCIDPLDLGAFAYGLMNTLLKQLAVGALLLAAPFALSAQTSGLIFSEDFEETTGSDLPLGWSLKDSNSYGVTMDNPSGSGRVLSFTGTNGDGDTMTRAIDLSSYFDNDGVTAWDFELSFKFFTPEIGDHKGIIGIHSEGLEKNDIIWFAGSEAGAGGAGHNNTGVFQGTGGSWETITVSLTDLLTDMATDPTYNMSEIQFNFEKWSSNTVPSNQAVYFDDIALTAIPEPSTYAMIGGLLALGSALLIRRNRKA